jgi:hypothetical protein
MLASSLLYRIDAFFVTTNDYKLGGNFLFLYFLEKHLVQCKILVLNLNLILFTINILCLKADSKRMVFKQIKLKYGT